MKKQSMKLGSLIQESWYDESKKLTTEKKADFVKKVSNYGGLGKSIYSEHNLVEIAKQLAEIAQAAETIALNETGEDFDKITIERNMKELKGLSTNFAKVATEAQSLRGRLTGLYEDMGHILNRYYNIEEISEEVEQEIHPELKSPEDAARPITFKEAVKQEYQPKLQTPEEAAKPITFTESNQLKSVTVKTPNVFRM